MNRNIASALVLAVAAVGNAFADDITVDPNTFVSSRSRAQVQAELAQYKQAGVNPWSTSYNQLRGFASSKSREQVTREYLAARDEVAALNAEGSGPAFLARGARAGASQHASTPYAAQ